MRILALALVLVPTLAVAKFARVDTKKVPVERLLKNLEKLPASSDILARRARVHAMAYANESADVNVRTDEPNEPFEGYVPDASPGPRRPGKPTEKSLKHLDEAIALYRKALEASPNDPYLRLGLGWCLLEKGDKAAARAELDVAFEGAWKQDSVRESLGKGNVLTLEILATLRPLLDKTKDAAKLAELDRREKELARKPRWITPVLVPVGRKERLDDLVDRKARVAFDLDGTGASCRWTWISENSAWLVWDPERTGRVRSGLDLFGNVTFWIFWNDGYEALGSLDDDRDGMVSGDELEGLALWRKDGTVTPVADAGVVAFRYTGERETKEGPKILKGVRFADGREMPTYDWTPRCR